jgi:hypothetical protein
VHTVAGPEIEASTVPSGGATVRVAGAEVAVVLVQATDTTTS